MFTLSLALISLLGNQVASSATAVVVRAVVLAVGRCYDVLGCARDFGVVRIVLHDVSTATATGAVLLAFEGWRD
jgi:hypothetical protein